MKKTFAIFLAFSLLFCVGCTGKNSIKNANETTNIITEESTEFSEENTSHAVTAAQPKTEPIQTESSTAATKATTTVKTVSTTAAAKTTVTSWHTTATDTHTTIAITTAHTTVRETETTAIATTHTTQAVTTQPPVITLPISTTAKPTTPPPAKKISVTVHCDCKTAVEYGIRNQGGFSKLIPENGVLFNASVTVAEGSSAMDAIEAAAQQNNIIINAQSGYIKSVNGLAEKACGGTSGWLYSVNGEFPKVASDRYTLKNGDTVRLIYSVKNGDVTQLDWSNAQ